MGTRCLTVVQEKENNIIKEITVIYRQFDGYLDGHGLELLNFLEGFKVCNGYTASDKKIKATNGAGCLAAQIIAHFKEGIGNIYIEPAGTRNCGEAYTYYVILDGNNIIVRVEDFEGEKVMEEQVI